uniref:RIN4 pathogenic type III effector avirulence factor Avr cleavage site domain-containing protein n=1 Tax=Solanum tuberosum TaxID=4113 RepID=M1CYD6_SOLTU
MEDRKEKAAPWLSVPQFGDWDQKGALPDYSMDFSKIRENRKQNKSRASLGNEEDFNSISTTSNNNNVNTSHSTQNNDQTYHQKHSPTHVRFCDINSFIYPCFLLS